MPVHAYVDDDHCYHCGLRGKGVSVAPSAMPSRMSSTPPAKANPAWERGRAGEHRRDGSFMPYLVPGTTRPMPIKEYSENRHQVDEAVKSVRQGNPPPKL